MAARGRNNTSDNHCAIKRSIPVQWHWSESMSCEQKYPRHIQANWFALFAKANLSSRNRRVDMTRRVPGTGPQMNLLVLIMSCTPAR
jgi:hypothetical protein